jgi:hypothetical protein
MKKLGALSCNRFLAEQEIRRQKDEGKIITINAPLILKMREIIFFAGKLLYGPFQGIF